MNESDQKEFLELVGDLYGAHGQNLRSHVATGMWKGLKHMTLGELRRVIEDSIDRMQHTERGVTHPPNVAEIWDRHRELNRAPSAEAAQASAKYQGDGWSVNANLLLLAHIRRNTTIDYAPDARGNPVQFGEHTEAIAKILAKWKNAWARDMREDRELYEGSLDGRKSWADCMAAADAEVRAYVERYLPQAKAA